MSSLPLMVSIKGSTLMLRTADNILRGFMSCDDDTLQIWTLGVGKHLKIYTGTDGHVIPGTANMKLGTVSDPWYGVYVSNRLKIPVGTDMYD